jgi:hypothetical protein
MTTEHMNTSIGRISAKGAFPYGNKMFASIWVFSDDTESSPYLSGRLEKTQLVPQLFLGDSSWGVDLVTKDEERYARELFH